MSRTVCLALAHILLLLAAPGAAQDSAAPSVEPGDYRDRSSFEAFHGLRLNPDGTYEWALSVGAMDRRSAGTWTQHAGLVTLTTNPTPVPPEFRRDADDPSADVPFLLVRWPSGRGIAGIDLTLVCSDGKRITHYTQQDGWSLVPGECDEPEQLVLEEPIQNVGPASFELDGTTRGLRFTLVPNDIGIEDLTGTQIRADGSGISLWLLNTMATMERVASE